jgi:predicted ArsR family transcriptional regulator
MDEMADSIFGNAVAEKTLLYIANYGEGHINGVARTFGVSPSQAQKQLVRLEAAGVLVSRMVGNSRVFTINPRLAYKKELVGLLEKILSVTGKDDLKKYYRQRTRPRRTGKEL